MICPKCGYTQEEAVNFCPKCGSPMQENIQQDASGQQENTYSQQTGYNQQNGYNQQAGYNQQNGYNQQAGYNQQNGYNQQAGYNQQNGYNQQTGYNQQNGYNQQYGYNQQMGYGQPGGYQYPPIRQKNIALCVVLTIVTCGIYGIIWFISMVDDLNTASGQTNDTSGGIVFLLSLVTCGIYLLYWMYKAGEKVAMIRRANGMQADSSTGILYLVLSIFGLAIVSYCLIQNELNQVGIPE